MGRVMRVARLVQILNRFADKYPSLQAGLLIADIVKIVVGILWINHLICCGWYALGNVAISDTGVSWLDVSDGTVSYGDAGFWYQYTTSFEKAHWNYWEAVMQIHSREGAPLSPNGESKF